MTGDTINQEDGVEASRFVVFFQLSQSSSCSFQNGNINVFACI